MVRLTGAACLAATLSGASARANAEDGLAIMRQVESAQNVKSRTNVGLVEVTDRKRKVSRKRWQVWADGLPGERRVLVRFLDPPEIRDVGLLTLNHRGRAAEQWIYTPAIKRERRLTGAEKAGRFMGTDFANEDMEERSVEDYQYSLLGEDTLDGRPVHKIKAVPKDPRQTQYSHVVFWIRKDLMATALTEFYVDGRRRKALSASAWERIQGVWTPRVLEMEDADAASGTRVQLSEVEYDRRFPPDWFTLRQLRR